MKQNIVEIFFAGKNFSAHIPLLPGCISTGKTPDEIKNKMLDENLFECIQWSKKYDMPLIKPMKKMESILSNNILADMFSFEKQISFSFKYHQEDYKPEIDTTISVLEIPKIFKSQVSNFLFESKSLNTHNLDYYNKIKTDIDYYQKKIIKSIRKKYNIKKYSDNWLKIYEIYFL